MAANGVQLLSDASATGNWVRFRGGRGALVTFLGSGGALPTTFKLQMQAKDGSTAIDVATLAAAGITSYDLPAGLYRMLMSGGTPSHVNADLVPIPYN